MSPLAVSWSWITLASVVSAGAFLAIFGRALVGPVLIYEMIRAARRGRYFLMRTLYALFLFGLLLWVHSLWYGQHVHSRANSQNLAELAESFFYTYAAVQAIAVCLLTPGYVAGCIAEDKERRTMDFLLATDLANREIVFGKMVARIGNLLMFLLAGLPVLSIIQFFGGIDPGILLVTFGATAMTMFGLVGVSIVQSVQRRKARDAILLTYVIAIAYLGVSWMTWGLESFATVTPGTLFANAMRFVSPALDILHWGDPVRAFADVTMAINTTGIRGEDLLRILGKYAAFHGAVFVVGVTYAIWRLRKVALAQAGGGSATGRKRVKRIKRPSVSSQRPMHWKEIYVEGTLRLGWFGRIGLNVIIAMGFTPLILGAYLHFFDSKSAGQGDITQFLINPWVRGMNAVICTLMLLGIAIRAAGAIGSERDGDTLISLLTTPLTTQQIMWGKFWGAIASVRNLGYWLAIVWLIGVVTGSVNPVSIVLEVLVFTPLAVASAAIGLFTSVSCRTTLRSIVWTLVAMVYMLGAHWLFGCMCCYAPIAFGGRSSDMQYIYAFEVGGTPSAAFGTLPFHPEEHWYLESDGPAFIAMGLLGVYAWLAVGIVLLMIAFERFSKMANRSEHRPQPIPPPEVTAA